MNLKISLKQMFVFKRCKNAVFHSCTPDQVINHVKLIITVSFVLSSFKKKKNQIIYKIVTTLSLNLDVVIM